MIGASTNLEHWTTLLFALLPHPSQPAVLGISTSVGPRLPQVSLAEPFDPAQIDRVQAGLNPICGMPFNVLRCLRFEVNPPNHRTDGLYLLEARAEGFPTGDLPHGWVWMRLGDLSSGLVPQVLQSSLTGWIAAQKPPAADESRSLLAPWARSGWYAPVEAWIAAEMVRLDQPVRLIEALKSWSISAILRVQTGGRPVFFKATRALPLFVNEGKVMAALAQLYPEHVPAPLAVDADRGWMLMEDLGQPLGRGATLEQQARLFQTMARLQIDSTGRIDHLLQAGCIDRRIPWLQARLNGLLSDPVTLSRLAPAERGVLIGALPRLQSLLSELDALPIPAALIHGDLHAGNVAIRDGRIQIFDWTDAAISHPFFDLDAVFNPAEPARREILAQAYLSAWEKVYPAAQVRRAFNVARVVYGLHHAVSYQFILNHLDEADREEINSAHYFLRQVLAGLEN